ncbi:MAG: dinitrogenase iron-molybdenum cofactor biosynthesis protein [Lentisphaeria bacterium]|nr:dinitrogenase iron-molybdenum cofactor biosynthesis protein [Lentisphaeria bacterium]
MKIAVTCENHQVFQHFGHTPEFAIFEIEDGKIIDEKIISSGEEGHGALAQVLANEAVDTLICGGIGGGAINALAQANIQVIGGAEGDVREVIEALINGTLEVRSDFHCNHHHDHEEGHSCGGHTCGHGSCGH